MFNHILTVIMINSLWDWFIWATAKIPGTQVSNEFKVPSVWPSTWYIFFFSFTDNVNDNNDDDNEFGSSNDDNDRQIVIASVLFERKVNETEQNEL